VNLEEGLQAGPNARLILAGSLIALVGLAGALFASSHWNEIIVAAKDSLATAAGIFVASSGIFLVGLFLVYAGLGRKRALA
jgi:hypothetical protein